MIKRWESSVWTRNHSKLLIDVTTTLETPECKGSIVEPQPKAGVRSLSACCSWWTEPWGVVRLPFLVNSGEVDGSSHNNIMLGFEVVTVCVEHPHPQRQERIGYSHSWSAFAVYRDHFEPPGRFRGREEASD